MAKVWNKIDQGLATIYADFLQLREQGQIKSPQTPVIRGEERLHASLRFRGSLTPVENAGYETIWSDGQSQSTGWIWLKDLENICDLDEVITVSYGTQPHVDLDVSVPQIKADQVWSLAAGGVFSGPTGAGMIVGVIDTGVDINHKFLWRQTIPITKTRIKRIWDMGLVKVAGENEPDVALLDPGTPGTYGVEYTDVEIDKVLQGVVGAQPIRHRDCAGHGTHVASTAAGDGRFKFKRVGVAPRADLIIVKLLHLENEPAANFDQRFKDAVTYIRNVAGATPFVINYSAGSSLGPHDGLTEAEDWLANEFRDANAAGKIFVTSAGNSAGKRQHARLEFTAAITDIELPFELFDTRAVFTDSDSCVAKDNTKILTLDFYYPNGGATVTFELKPQGEAAFTAGPVLGDPPVTGTFSSRDFKLFHSVQTDVLLGGATIERNNFAVQLEPDPVTRHLPGTYVVKMHASAPVTVHVWCFQHSRKQGLRVGPDPLPAGVTHEDKFLVGKPGSASNVITVAAYDPRAPLDVASFSSRGPLARHGVGAAPPAKPEIGAPGVGIQAARSSQSTIVPATETTSMQGTSMASPHVAGTVALLFQKSATLTPSQAVTKLQANALKVPAPVADEIGGGRLDAKKTFDNTP
jgi:subtilisin family serine protease